MKEKIKCILLRTMRWQKHLMTNVVFKLTRWKETFQFHILQFHDDKELNTQEVTYPFYILQPPRNLIQQLKEY